MFASLAMASHQRETRTKERATVGTAIVQPGCVCTTHGTAGIKKKKHVLAMLSLPFDRYVVRWLLRTNWHGTQNARFPCLKQENGGHVVGGSLCLLSKSDLEATRTSCNVLFPPSSTIKVVKKIESLPRSRSFMGLAWKWVQFVNF